MRWMRPASTPASWLRAGLVAAGLSFAACPPGFANPAPRSAIVSTRPLGSAPAGGAGSAPRWAARRQSDRVDYRIQAAVSDDDQGRPRRLQGSLELAWTNDSDAATDRLWFHLYWNAFAGNRSTHLIESGGALRGRDVKDEADEWGWQRITSVRFEGAELTDALRIEHPDGGPEDDRSVLSVALPRAIQPGETAKVALSWEALIPRVRRRTGFKDDFLFIAHWYPTLGVFQGAQGWNCHEFHANTEFFSNFGWYDVTLDLPRRFEKKVFASGLQVGPATVSGDRVTTTFAAPSPQDRQRPDALGKLPVVHNFTWTADPRYKLRTGTFNFDLWRSRYPDEVDEVQRALGQDKNLRLRTVNVAVVIHPEREDQWERHLEATCAALFFYGLWFGEYPYEQITCVDPAWGAEGAGGMEYPTLFTAGTRLFTRPSMHTPEGVTVHEAGHQFWYGLVGNNEFESAWLDEGFNSYTDSEVLWRVWGPRLGTTEYSNVPFDGEMPVAGPGGGTLAKALAFEAMPVPWVGFTFEPLRAGGLLQFWRDQPWLTAVKRSTDPRWSDRVRYLGDPDRDEVDRAGWLYADRRSYSNNSYARPAVALRSLCGLVGRETFLRAMRSYSESWRYRHPTPNDFFSAFSAAAGSDLTWYFDQAFRSSATVDWSVEVKQKRAPRPAGWSQADAAGPFERIGVGDADARPRGHGETEPWHAEVEVVRRGELALPLVIELTFEEGSPERRVWTLEEQSEQRWLRLVLEGRPKLVAVRLDPDAQFYFDRNLSDNAWYDVVDRLTPVRWSERAFQRWLHVLFFQSGIGG